jgi:ABC-type transport system substrate-binding protein
VPLGGAGPKRQDRLGPVQGLFLRPFVHAEHHRVLDQVQQVKALPDVTSEIKIGLSFAHFDFDFKNEFLADVVMRKAIATGLNTQELVDCTVKQFSDNAQTLRNRTFLTGPSPRGRTPRMRGCPHGRGAQTAATTDPSRVHQGVQA